MKLEPVQQLGVFYQPSLAERQRVGRLVMRDRQILFQFDTPFIASGLELSPFKLPLESGVQTGPPLPFDGLFGVFDDSLPDGWGRLLVDRRAAKLGISANTLTPLDRLAIVGHRTMGALVYEPEADVQEPTRLDLSKLADEVERVVEGTRGDLEQLVALGGSPKGARPKVLVQIDPAGTVYAGARDLAAGRTAWLVKFPSRGDDRHAGPLEHAYCLMARAAGIDVPRTQLLGATRRNPGYFAIERFDRSSGRRRHVHTLGGLLHLPQGYPAFDYVDVLGVTRELTRDEGSVAEMYRRACFNVLARNRDDHSRNFAFMMSTAGTWTLAPAYDLTFAEGPGGEHTTLVVGEGQAPTLDHLGELAKRAGLKRAPAARIVDEVRAAIAAFDKHATRAGVPAKLRTRVGNALGAGADTKKSRSKRTSRR